MDPATAGFIFGTEALKFISKVYDDTPKEERVKDIMFWREMVSPVRDMMLDLSRLIKQA